MRGVNTTHVKLEEGFWTQPKVASTEILVAANVIAGLMVLVNIPHLIVLIRMPRERYYAAKNNRTLLLNLAVLDMLGGLIRLPLNNAAMQTILAQHRWLCALSAATCIGFNITLESVILLGAIDRLLAVTDPNNYRRRFFVRHFSKFLLPVYIAWASVFGGITLSGWNQKQGFQLRGHNYCMFNLRSVPYVPILITSAVFIPIFVGFILYGVIICYLYKRSGSTSKQTRYALQAGRIIVVIGFLQLLCWTPLLVQMIMKHLKIRSIHVSYTVIFSVSFNGVTHPLVYGIMNQRYRTFIIRSLGFQKIRQTSSVETSDNSRVQSGDETNSKNKVQNSNKKLRSVDSSSVKEANSLSNSN